MIFLFFSRLYKWWAHERALLQLGKAGNNTAELVATALTPEAMLKRACEGIQNLREGELFPDTPLRHIEEALEAGWAYSDIGGTTKAEVEDFQRGKNAKEFAQRELAKYRQKPYGHDTTYLEYVLIENKLTPEDVGTTAKEIKKFQRELDG